MSAFDNASITHHGKPFKQVQGFHDFLVLLEALTQNGQILKIERRVVILKLMLHIVSTYHTEAI
jgi:hypothetical protein